MKRFTRFILKYPLAVIILIILITLIFAAGLPYLKRESDIKKLLPSSSVSVKTYNEIDDRFGGADRLILIVEDDEICDEPTLSKIRKITERLKEIPGVNRVLSITDMDEIKPVPDGIEVTPLLSEIPEDKAELKAFKNKLLSDDRYVEKFISRDGRASLIMAMLFVERDNAETVREAREFAKEFEGPERILISGTPEIAENIMSGMSEDLIRLIPLVIFLVAFILYVGFRNWYGVLLPLLTVSLATIWSMGLMAFLKRPITVIATAIPVLLIAVGSAYGIHLISRIEEEDECKNKEETLEKALSGTGLAILIAALTTAAGFISNMVSDISAIKYFGIFTAFGVMASFLLTVTFIPAVIKLIPCIEITPEKRKGRKEDILGRLLAFISGSITNKKSLVVPVTAGLFILAAFGYPRLSTETDPVRYFGSKTQVVRTSELVREKFGGSITLDILFKGDLKDPELLSKIDRFSQRLQKIDILNKPYSVIEALKETNRYMNNDQQEFYRLPRSRQGVAQYLLFLSFSGGGFLDSLITSDNEEMILSFRIATTRSTPIDRMVRVVQKEIKGIFPDNEVEIRLSGMGVIMKDMREMLINNQIQSLILALIVVFFMIFLLYRTWLGALYCMVPILLTLLLNFGVMGWFNIALDMATVLVASIAVGLGIDYSVHLFNRYKEERKVGKERKPSLDKALKSVGKPIIYNAVSVALGFLVLIFSRFAIMRNFGILIALTMFFSSFGALAILPELLMIKVRIIDFNNSRRNNK